MKQFAIDLSKYKYLQRLLTKDQRQFVRVMQDVLEHMDNAVKEKRLKHAEKVYKMDYVKMMDDIMDAFFDTEGIAEKHHHEGEKTALKGLGENLHPLAIFTNHAAVYNAKGENVSPAKWIEQDEFDLKNWLYALFYGARFVSWQELAEYLTLGQYDLVEVLKARNFEQLSHIQEELALQKKRGIPVGKLIPGTGKLDLGEGTIE